MLVLYIYSVSFFCGQALKLTPGVGFAGFWVNVTYTFREAEQRFLLLFLEKKEVLSIQDVCWDIRILFFFY
jgi:hypothetical protein